jgi:hypothetical protein
MWVGRFTARICLVLSLAWVFGSCAASGPTTRAEGDLSAIKRVLVLPFEDMAWLYGANTSVRNPITGQTFQTGPVAREADRYLTEELIAALRQYTQFKLVNSYDGTSIREGLENAYGSQWPLARILAETGRRMDADAVVIGYVYRFRERVGGPYAAEQSASVAFDICIIACRTAKPVWVAYNDETQLALAEDLLDIGSFFRRKGRWVTAEEMAQTAIKRMFEEFPKQ